MRKLTQNEVATEVATMHIEGLKLYPHRLLYGNTWNVKTICLRCGKQWWRTLGNLRKGCGCMCNRNTKYNTEAERTLAERYHAIVQRCKNTGADYQKNYGARGIENRFSCAEDFVSYMVSNHPHPDYKGIDIDRVDNDGHYEPGNLRLATRSQNLNNRRFKQIPFNGQLVNLKDIAEEIRKVVPEFGYKQRGCSNAYYRYGCNTGEKLIARWNIYNPKTGDSNGC